MISAGEQVKLVKDQQRDFICGGHFVKAQEEVANSATATAEEKEMAQAQAKWLEVNAADSTCEAKFEELWDKYTSGLDETQKLFFEAEAGFWGAFSIYQRCQNKSQFMFDKSLESAPALAHCTSYYLNPDQLPFTATFEEIEGEPTLNLPEVDTSLSYHGKDMAGYEEVLAHIKLAALEMIDKAGITSEGIEMPQSLKDFIEELRKAFLPEHAALAEKLFYQGVGLTKPSGAMAIAAQPIADHVEEYVRDKAGKPFEDFDNASDADKPDIAADNIDKTFPELEYVFVASTAPKKDNYKVDIKEAPKAIKDYFKDFPPPIRREALRLYGEALEKAGKGAKDEDVAKLLVKKIKEEGEKVKGDKAKLADKLMHLRVDQVKMPNTMILKEINFPGAPADLHERIGTEGSRTKGWIINSIWNQVRAKLKDQGVEAMDLKLMEKIVDDLATQLKGKSIKELASHKAVAVNKKTGKVTLQEIPEEIEDIIYGPIDLLPYHLGQEGAGMIMLQTSDLYQAADPSLKDQKKALKIAEAAEKYLDPKQNKWTDDGKEAVRVYLGTEFDGWDENGDAKLKEKIKSTGNPDGSYEEQINEDLKFIYNVKGEGAVGSVIGAGDNDPGFIGMALVNAMMGFHSSKAGNFKLKFGLEAFSQNEMFAQGEPRNEFNWDYNGAMNSTDNVYLFRLGHAVVEWDKKVEGEKVDVTPKFGIGLMSTRPKFGSDLGMNWDTSPIASFQPLAADSSKGFGLSAAIALGFADKHKLTIGGILTNPAAAVQYDSEGKFTTWESGVKGGGHVEVDFELADNDKIEAHLKMRGEGQGSTTGDSVVGGGLSAHMLLSDHWNLGLGLGGGYKGADGPDYRYFGAGGYFSYQTKLGKSDVTMEIGLSGAGKKLWTKDLTIALDPLTVDDTGDEDCGVYECPDDQGADIGDDGNGGLSGTGDLANQIEGGLSIFEGRPFMKFLFGDTGLYTDVGVSILYVNDVTTGSSDVVVIPMLRFGGVFKNIGE